MPKLDMTAEEVTIILNALDNEVKSAKRAQKTGKTPRIMEIYKEHERVLQALAAKVATSK